MHLRHIGSLVRQSVSAWSDDRAPSMGAALSYYALFSIAPLLVIAIAIAGLIFGPDAVSGAVFAQLADLMGEDGARATREMLAYVNRPATGGLAALGSAVVLLLGAALSFVSVMVAFAMIYKYRPPARRPAAKHYAKVALAAGFVALALLRRARP